MSALETREETVGALAGRLRGQIAGSSEELARAELELSRLQITRETVAEVLAGDAAGGVAPSASGSEGAAELSADDRKFISLFATSGAAMRCKEVCAALGLGTEARHLEGMRAKLKRLVGQGMLAESAPGLFKVDGRKLGW